MESNIKNFGKLIKELKDIFKDFNEDKPLVINRGHEGPDQTIENEIGKKIIEQLKGKYIIKRPHEFYQDKIDKIIKECQAGRIKGLPSNILDLLKSTKIANGQKLKFIELIRDLLYDNNPILKSLLGTQGGVSKNDVRDYILNKKPIRKKQQEPADFLILDNSIGIYNSIDVKSHKIELDSRPPNMISMQRLTDLFAQMVNKKVFDTIHLVFIGVKFRDSDTNKYELTEIEVVDFFSMDLDKSNITYNIDAALQLQFWADEAKTKEQTRQEFIKRILSSFIETYSNGVERLKRRTHDCQTILKSLQSPSESRGTQQTHLSS